MRALVITGVIFSPKNAKIPVGTEDVKSFLKGKFKEVVKENRFFPAFDSLTTTDSSEDAVIGTLAGGYSEKLRDGNAIYQFDYPFGLCKAKSLRQFDGWNGGVFLVSKEGYVIGRKQSNGDLAATNNSTSIIPVNSSTSKSGIFSVMSNTLRKTPLSPKLIINENTAGF